MDGHTRFGYVWLVSRFRQAHPWLGMLINAEPFLYHLRQFRTLWIEGAYGSYKTAFAFRCAYELLSTYGYKYLLTNTPSVWSDNPDEVNLDANNELRTVVILDEAGEFLNLKRETTSFVTFMRKMDTILIMPSISEVAIRLRKFRCSCIFRGISYGLPMAIFAWRLRVAEDYRRGYVIWWRTNEIYNIYNTQDPPSDDGGLSGYFDRQLLEFSRRYGREYRKPGRGVLQVEEGGGQSGDETSDTLSESASAILEASENFISFRRAKKGRRF